MRGRASEWTGESGGGHKAQWGKGPDRPRLRFADSAEPPMREIPSLSIRHTGRKRHFARKWFLGQPGFDNGMGAVKRGRDEIVPETTGV
ncbi:hypothetical protein BaRGS_00023293 [Batillaria attramentaria]|uniref:Uncharacterized protein n=1 Tax=Batillaria attramentaria TaxID=370345 RepID=A0ABD0KE79_9CAEN